MQSFGSGSARIRIVKGLPDPDPGLEKDKYVLLLGKCKMFTYFFIILKPDVPQGKEKSQKPIRSLRK